MFINSNIIFGIGASDFMKRKMINHALSTMFFLFIDVFPKNLPLNMLVIILLRLYPHEFVRI